MTKKKANLDKQKSKSPSFEKKLKRAAQQKVNEAKQAHRKTFQGPTYLPPSERSTVPQDVRDARSQAYSLSVAVERKVSSFEPSVDRITLRHGTSICPVSFTRLTGGYNAHLVDEADHGRWVSMLNEWLVGKSEVTLCRGTTEVVATH